MLPQHMHDHDEKWIKGMLERVPFEYQPKVCSGYDAIYREAYQAELVDHKKINAARKAANERLRVYLGKALK